MLPDAFRNFCSRAIVAVKRQGNVYVELWAVGRESRAKFIEGRHRSTGRIFVGLQHQRGDGADEGGLGNASCAVTSEVARHFAASSGMSDQDGVLKVESVEQLGEIVCVSIHV